MKRIVPFLALACCACVSNSKQEYVPTDYSSASSWYSNGKQIDTSLVDVFYVLPTCVVESVDSAGNEVFQANLSDQSQRDRMEYSYRLANEIFADSANFFAPYYQQVTLNGYFSTEYEAVLARAMDDVKRAFDYYLANFNNGRRFVLAGFSQGGKGVVELLHHIDDETFSRMIASYVVGYVVTSADTMESRHFVPAKSADDQNVVIAYNTVQSPECSLSWLFKENLFCINPVSWSTDCKPAHLNDSVTVTLDSASNLLLIDGLNAKDYSPDGLEKFFPLGNYHLGELTLYQEFLKENVKRRSEGD